MKSTAKKLAVCAAALCLLACGTAVSAAAASPVSGLALSGVAMPWDKYLGSYGKPVSIEQFGLQGDGAQNMIDLGITAEHVVEAAKASIAEVEAAK